MTTSGSRDFNLDVGEIIEEAPPEEFFSNPKEERARRFLDHIL